MACTRADCTKNNISRNAAADVTKGMASRPLAKGGCMPRGVGEIRTLFDFDKPMAALSFRAVNDTVHGGGSSCEVKYLPKLKCSQFFGRLNFVRGGGWASVRSAKMDSELIGTHGVLLLSSSTDGNQYKVVIRTKAWKDTAACLWHCDFHPSKDVGGCWRVTMLRYTQFSAVLRGEPFHAGGPLYPEAVDELGLMISRTAQDGTSSIVKEGEFDMKIKWIRGFFASLQSTDSPLLPPPKSPLASPHATGLLESRLQLGGEEEEEAEAVQMPR